MKTFINLSIFSFILTFGFNAHAIPSKGQFNIPVGTNSAGPAGPGTIYEFTFVAQYIDKVTLATMILESNDWFIASADPTGIHPHDIVPLVDTIVNITDLFAIYDAGTEVDQDLGKGHYQAPRQSTANSGPADPNPLVRKVDQANYLASDFVEVMLIRLNESEFQVTVMVKENSPSAVSPGVWTIFQTEQNPLFIENTEERAIGLEQLAEDGDPKLLYIHI